MVTFKTKHYANIMMFDTVAAELLAMMNTSQNVPGAIPKEEVHAALSSLQEALVRLPIVDNDEEVDEGEDEKEPRINLHQRSVPLIALLESALKYDKGVVWER